MPMELLYTFITMDNRRISYKFFECFNEMRNLINRVNTNYNNNLILF